MTANPPSAQSQMVDDGGFPKPYWMRFFQNLVGAPSAITSVAVGASPVAYTASNAGSLVIVGGTVTAIRFTRARSTIGIPNTQTSMLMGKGDSIRIAFTDAPVVNFVPS